MNLQHVEMWALRPDFVLLSFLRKVNEDFAWSLSELGIPFGVLDSEGGVRTSIDSFAVTMARRSVRNRAAFFCSWGPRFAEYAVKKGWYGKDQMVVTGCPRYDYYGHPWRQVASRLSPPVESTGSPLVLVNGNFPLANPRFQTPELEVEMYVKLFGMERQRVFEDQSTQARTMRELVALVDRLAQRFPEVTFVYRPHPFERLNGYKGLLGKRNNLLLNRDGSVDGWILRSQAVIQRSCSTAIESSIAGVPALSPTWIPAHVLPLAEAASISCPSEDELVQTLRSILEGRFQYPPVIRDRLEQLIGDWYLKIDGNAHRRVAECILRNLSNRMMRKHTGWHGAYYWARLKGHTPRSMIGAALRKLLGLRTDHALPSWEDSGKFFDAHQVRTLVDAMGTCAQNGSRGRFRQVRAQQARERGDYRCDHPQGRSVTVFPG